MFWFQHEGHHPLQALHLAPWFAWRFWRPEGVDTLHIKPGSVKLWALILFPGSPGGSILFHNLKVFLRWGTKWTIYCMCLVHYYSLIDLHLSLTSVPETVIELELEHVMFVYVYIFSRRCYPKRLTYVRLTLYTHFTFTLMAHCTSGAIRGSVSCSRTLQQGIELATFWLLNDFSTYCTTVALL